MSSVLDMLSWKRSGIEIVDLVVETMRVEVIPLRLE